MASTDARPLAQKNVAYRVTFPILDADGDLVTGATGLDSEISKDGGTFADCTNEATEIATSSGMYYLDLTSTEMNADTVAIIVKTSSSGAKTTPMVFYPEEAGDIRVNATQWNSLTTVALPLVPTTAGRTLDVSATGEAGLDWANIGSPTTAVNLSGTNIDVDQVVASVSGAVNSVTGAVGSVTGAVGSVTGNVGGNVTGSVGSVATGGITAASFAADAITAAKLAADVTTELQSGLATAANLATVAGYLDTEIAAILADTNELQTDWANGGRLDLILDARASQSSVDDLPTNAELATSQAAADDATLAAIAALSIPSAATIADAVWDEVLSGHLTGGSTGNALNAAGSAGDPWSTALPGAYSSGTAGKIIGDNINATISSRSSQTSVDDVPTNAELTTALGTADDAVLAAIAALNNLSQANIRTAVGLASANLDTQLDALPTNSELTTALGTADDAVLAAVAALNNLSSAQVQTAAEAALTAYDPPTRTEATADKDEVIVQINANETKIDTLQTSVNDVPTNAELTTALGTADDAVLAQVALVKAKTDLIPTDPADQSAVEAAITAATSGLASQSSVNTIDDLLDTEIAAIKAKTDSLTFTEAGVVDANIQYVNDVAVQGTGETGDEWGPV